MKKILNEVMGYILKKTVAIVLFIGLIFLSFSLFAKDVFSILEYLIAIISFLFFICTDLLIRPISTKKDNFRTSISVILFLLVPLLLVFPFLENEFFVVKYFPQFDVRWVSYLGIGLLFLGGTISLSSRIQIGRFGSSKITIEDNHSLIINGLYKYVRHPIYLGFLLLFFGFLLSFRSIFFTILISFGLFIVFRNRMEIEEKLLSDSFGKEYESYVKRTKRLIPYLY